MIQLAKNRFAKNIFSLGFIQIANYLFPFITIPYVVRIIGPEKLGFINLAQAVIAYLIMIVNFGFDFTATRDISINRDSPQKINEIFNTVITAKIILFATSFVIFVVLIQYETYAVNSVIFWYTYLTVLAAVFFPTWYFQGREQLTKVAAVNFISRFLIMVLTFALIHDSSDYVLVPLITGIGQLVLNLGAFVYVVVRDRVLLFLPRIASIKQVLSEGKSIFLSTIVINVYLTGNIIILGIFSPGESVGFFSSAAKVISLYSNIMMYPIYQSLFPHLSKSFSDNIDTGFYVLRKMFVIVLLISIPSSLALFLFAKPVTLIIYGNKFFSAIPCLQIIALLPVITGITNVLGVQGIVNLKRDKTFLLVTASGALVSIIMNVILARQFTHIGTSFAWLISEAVVMCGFIVSIYKIYPQFYKMKEFINVLKNLRHMSQKQSAE